jgi:hypothetical protein
LLDGRQKLDIEVISNLKKSRRKYKRASSMTPRWTYQLYNSDSDYNEIVDQMFNTTVVGKG